MKYPCDLIQDLLPLYLDGVCSEESKKAVEKHLSECSGCKELYNAMRETDGIEINAHNADRERQKAASFRAIKKKMFLRQLFAAFSAVVLLAAISFAAIGILKGTVEIVEYKDNISVSMVDGDLIGRLQGSQQTYVKIKRITNTVNGQEKNYLFFHMSDTKWDALITGSEVFSEYTLCPNDKGADEIDAVYYFTGDYTDIENMSSEELQTVIAASELLWIK